MTIRGAEGAAAPSAALTPAEKAAQNAAEFYRVREVGKAIENYERCDQSGPRIRRIVSRARTDLPGRDAGVRQVAPDVRDGSRPVARRRLHADVTGVRALRDGATIRSPSTSTSRPCKIRNDDPDIFLNLGYAYEKMSMDLAALNSYRRAYELAPNDPRATQQLAHIYYRAGLYDQAIAAYERVRSYGGASSYTMKTLGFLYMKVGQASRSGDAVPDRSRAGAGRLRKSREPRERLQVDRRVHEGGRAVRGSRRDAADEPGLPRRSCRRLQRRREIRLGDRHGAAHAPAFPGQRQRVRHVGQGSREEGNSGGREPRLRWCRGALRPGDPPARAGANGLQLEEPRQSGDRATEPADRSGAAGQAQGHLGRPQQLAERGVIRDVSPGESEARPASPTCEDGRPASLQAGRATSCARRGCCDECRLHGPQRDDAHGSSGARGDAALLRRELRQPVQSVRTRSRHASGCGRGERDGGFGGGVHAARDRVHKRRARSPTTRLSRASPSPISRSAATSLRRASNTMPSCTLPPI